MAVSRTTSPVTHVAETAVNKASLNGVTICSALEKGIISRIAPRIITPAKPAIIIRDVVKNLFTFIGLILIFFIKNTLLN